MTTSEPRALSSKQERNLVQWLEENILSITAAYKKRSQPLSSKLPTLEKYLKATQEVLCVILQIPPIDPSTSLRITFLLRLTGDVLNSVPGYPAEPDVLPDLLGMLDDLDQAWVTVLQSQIWNPKTGVTSDLEVPADSVIAHPEIKSTPMNQTERTRLRSLVVSGTTSLEEWLGEMKTEGDEGYQEALERLGLQQGFDEVFARTLQELGALGGSLVVSQPMETCTS